MSRYLNKSELEPLENKSGVRVKVSENKRMSGRNGPEIEIAEDKTDNPANSQSISIRVLIVDDHEMVRQGIRALLNRADDVTVVGEAEDGETAIEMIQKLAPDVVLLDVKMQRIDGFGTIRRLHDLGLHPPIILLSGFDDENYVAEGLRAGAQGYLLKDVDRDQLLQAIITVHEGGSALDPKIALRLIKQLRTNRSSPLTNRELEVLQLVASGLRNKEISDRLQLSDRTVRFHVENIHRKLGVQNRTGAVKVATELGLL